MRFNFVVLFAFLTINLFSQTQSYLPQIVPSAPNTASISKFGDYDVSLYTGIPNISIPLYTIEVNGLKTSIDLSYHASGVKVGEFPGWVGSGWALQVGGQINRKMMGLADESLSGYSQGTMKDPVDLNLNSDANIMYLKYINDQLTDVEPDIFSYNFSGRSGKFFFNKEDSYKPAPIPFSPVKITKDNIASETIGFNILDEIGNQYLFGYTDRETTTTSGNPPTSSTSAWKLEKMISADKVDTIYFTYNTQYNLAFAENAYTWVVHDQVEQSVSGSTLTENPEVVNTNYTQGGAVEEKLNKEIKFRNGKVVFELTTASREDGFSGYSSKYLNRILVYNYDLKTNIYSIVKTIRFYYSYFLNGTAKTRLKLDKLSIDDESGSPVQEYSFNYNAESLPPQLTNKIDFWGYYNNKNNNSLIPVTTVDYKPGPAAPYTTITIGSSVPDGRIPDPVYTQAGILKKIIFPTGGYTEFEYENNKYESSQGIFYGGGLRIKNIKSYATSTSLPVVKTYIYGENGSGVGRANFIINPNLYSSTVSVEEYVYAQGTLIALNNVMRKRHFYSRSTMGPEPFSEYSVVYPYVTEYVGSELDNLGKTEYIFRDQNDAISLLQTLRPRVTSYFYDRGQISRKKIFKKLTSGYQIVQEEIYGYNAFQPKMYNNVGLIVNKRKYQFLASTGQEVGFPYNSPFSQGLWEYGYYPITTGDSYLKSKEIKLYDQTDITKFTTTTTTYAYNNFKHQQVNEMVFTNSKGEVTKSKNEYPADYLIGTNTTTGNTVLDDMMTKNMIAKPIESWSTLTQSGTEKTTSGLLNLYKKLGTYAIVPDKKMQLELANPVTDFVPSSVTSTVLQKDSRYSDQVVFDSYDAKNNPSQMTPRNAPTNAYIWDYNLSYPVAEAVGVGQNEMAYTSFEADGTGTWIYNDVGRPQVSGGVTGKKYLSLNSRDGNTISRENLTIGKTYVVSYWSESTTALTVTGGTSSHQAGETINGWTFHRHTVTATSTTITLTGGSHIDEIRLHPSTAKMTTYTYDPLVGMTSQCDINNKITYYEYDSFGRLKNILDQDRNVLKTYDYQYQQNINQ